MVTICSHCLPRPGRGVSNALRSPVESFDVKRDKCSATTPPPWFFAWILSLVNFPFQVEVIWCSCFWRVKETRRYDSILKGGERLVRLLSPLQGCFRELSNGIVYIFCLCYKIIMIFIWFFKESKQMKIQPQYIGMPYARFYWEVLDHLNVFSHHWIFIVSWKSLQFICFVFPQLFIIFFQHQWQPYSDVDRNICQNFKTTKTAQLLPFSKLLFCIRN